MKIGSVLIPEHCASFRTKKNYIFGPLLWSKYLEDFENFEFKIDHISKKKIRKNRKIIFSFFSSHCASYM